MPCLQDLVFRLVAGIIQPETSRQCNKAILVEFASQESPQLVRRVSRSNQGPDILAADPATEIPFLIIELIQAVSDELHIPLVLALARTNTREAALSIHCRLN